MAARDFPAAMTDPVRQSHRNALVENGHLCRPNSSNVVASLALSSLSRFGRLHGFYESTAKVAASCTASKHHILLTPFPTGDISFARDKVSNIPSSVNTKNPALGESNMTLISTLFLTSGPVLALYGEDPCQC
jgi:hypothetical protein